MIRAVGFDLGGTLLAGVHLKWLGLYRQALTLTAEACGYEADDLSLSAAEEVLKRYNTRLHPRTIEVPSAEIFSEVLRAWGVSEAQHLDRATDAFFAFFTRDSRICDDIVPVLETLRSAGIKAGVLTDTPYGMPRRLVERDVAPVISYFDAMLTSVEVGRRKPDPTGLLALAARLGVDPSEMAYVGDEPKDVEAAKSAKMLSVLIDREGTAPPCDEDIHLSAMLDLPAFLGI